jgi:hypothetical protein
MLAGTRSGGRQVNRAIVIALAMCVAASGAAQPPVAPAPRPAVGEVSLLVVENVNTPGRGVEYQRLLRVAFRKGVMQPPEAVWEGFVRFHSWTRLQLVQNRYVVTEQTVVIDLVTGKEIHPRSGRLVAVEGGQIVYRVEHTFGDREAGLYTFDLKTHAMRRVGGLGEGKYGLPGKRSPDGTKSVANWWDESDARVPTPYRASDELVLHRVGEGSRALGKAFTVQDAGVPFGLRPPVLWLDDERFVTQVRNGELVTVSLDGTRAPLVTVPAAGNLRSPPVLERDPGGRLIYSGYGGPTVVIDVKNRRWDESKWVDLGHGFEASEAAEKDGHLLRHKGQEIGRVWCWPRWQTVATDDYLAVVAWAGPPPDWGHTQELRVWSAATGEWSTHKPWVKTVVGWMK